MPQVTGVVQSSLLPRRDVHDNFEPMRCDAAVSPQRIVDPPCDCRGATAPADRREARQDLWFGVVRANRSDPLYLQRTVPRTRSLSIMDLGAQNRPSHL